ncbi:thymidylate synthase [Candidatus Woesearchaeota archaeon]|nr:thymidylate synthase [Candidatus Woesearchaeota archaeon]
MLELIKNQIGSNGEKGWPVAVRDRIAFPSAKELIVSEANVAVTFLWTMRDAVIPKLEKKNLAIATNFYTPAGLVGMLRNILANPYIRYIILLGEEYSSKSEGDKAKSQTLSGHQISELTSANALRAFFEKGINEERKIPGFENSAYFDKNIPTELINKVRENVELIDLNKKMPNAPLAEKTEKANEMMNNLEKKKPFLDKPFVFEYEEAEESFPYEGGPVIVHGSTIPKTWIEVIHNIYRYGRKNLMNANTDRWVKEINNMVAVIHDPQNMDLTVNPFLVPLTNEKIAAYQKEILSPLLPEGKAYTYGNKLRAYIFPSAKEIKDLVNSTEYKDFEFGKGPHLDANVNYKEDICEINQIKDIIDALKRDPYSKACVAITWHVQDELMRKHKSSPCLVFLQAVVQDEKLNLTVFFRSHDMTQGWPENAYGCAVIQKEIADGIKVESGILTIMSGSAQIYAHYYQQVGDMLKKHKTEEVNYIDPRGNFTIELKDGEILVKHIHPESNAVLEEFKGKTAMELLDNISLSTIIIDTRHAIYLGAELKKAENALNLGLDYEQDVELKLNKKGKNRLFSFIKRIRVVD